MANIALLRKYIQTGWTHETRNAFARVLGNKEFNTLKIVYSEIKDEIPFMLNAATQGDDILLSLSLKSEFIDDCTNSMDFPLCIRQKIKNIIDKILTSRLPKFKNKEIELQNIVHRLNNSPLDVSPKDIEKILAQELDFKYKEEAYSFSDVVKTKPLYRSSSMQKDPNFTSEIVNDNTEFVKKVAKLFGVKLNDNEFDTDLLNYTIKDNGTDIGYFSIKLEENSLYIANYSIYPNYRNTKKALNSILTVRERVLKIAEEKGIKTILTGVDDGNPLLLSLYKKFGFKENGRFFCSFIDDSGTKQTLDRYNLIGYI